MICWYLGPRRVEMSELTEKVLAYNREIKDALQTVYNELNHGQQKKLLKSNVVKGMFDRYGVEYEEE